MMSLIRLNRFIARHSSKCYSTSAITSTESEEYTTVPHYPPILDTRFEATLDRKKQSKHEEIKAVKTVEEKQIKLNMPKYYGFKCYHFIEDSVPYDNLHLAQHITRTHLQHSPKLSDFYKEIDVDSITKDLKSKLEDVLNVELAGYQQLTDKNVLTPSEREDFLATQIVRQVNRTIINNLVQDYPHLLDSQVDVEPRLEAFWFAGGMNPPKNVKRYRTGVNQEWRKYTENEPTDRAVQYTGKPMLTLRSKEPLRTLISGATADEFPVPKWTYDPRVVGTHTKHNHAANIPGYWPGDPHQFGLISFHNRGHLLDRHFNDAQDDREALHRQAILASFAWLNAQANFLGFTTFNDVTYPLVTQTIITNGRQWSFYSYQMNTLLVHGKHIDSNPQVNVCYATPEVNLYEEYKDGRIVGLNEDVLKMIVKYYANVPRERMGVNMRPYLSQGERTIADYKDVEKRNWLEREYKFLVSNRPRYKLDYEIYHWEKMYKIDHKTRPMDPRRRPFELFYKPSDRTLDDRQAFYVPKVLRPELPKNKGRYAKEYFP